MKGLAVVDKGLEEVARREIEEKTKQKGMIENTAIIFDVKKEEDLCALAYTCQSVRRILKLERRVVIDEDLEKTKQQLRKELSNFETFSKKAMVECERKGQHNFNSVDISKEVCDILREKGFKISMDDYDARIFIYINDEDGYIGLDFSGRDLSKRNYRIFTRPGSLKGTIGYALVRLSGYKEGDLLIDPYCESGIIPIEAAIFATKKPVHFYKKDLALIKIDSKYKKVLEREDKKTKTKVEEIYAYDKTLKNINSAKKNAKIAGVEKSINFSKTEIEWLDTKFDKESVNIIAGKFPSESKKISKSAAEKIYTELFYQAEFVLKKDGRIALCTIRSDLLKQIAKKKGFEVDKEYRVFSGQQDLTITIFKKVYK